MVSNVTFPKEKHKAPAAVLSALAPGGSTSSHEVATHSGGCQNMKGNRLLPHMLPALRTDEPPAIGRYG